MNPEDDVLEELVINGLSRALNPEEDVLDELVIQGLVAREEALLNAAAVLVQHGITPESLLDLTPEDIQKITGVQLETTKDIPVLEHFVKLRHKDACRSLLDAVVQQQMP